MTDAIHKVIEKRTMMSGVNGAFVLPFFDDDPSKNMILQSAFFFCIVQKR
jgi:hypothetical protein